MSSFAHDPPWPSEIRARVLAEHVEIRERLDALEVMLAEDDMVDLPAALEAFVTRFQDHTALEDRYLGPALADVDAFGDVRTGQLEEHHRTQNDELTALVQAVGSAASDEAEVRAMVRALVADIRADIRHEESELLRPDILRDDVISIGHAGG